MRNLVRFEGMGAKCLVGADERLNRSVAVLVIHFGTPSRQNDCARRQPCCAPVRPASVALRRHLASSTPAAHHSLKWLDGVSHVLAYALRRLRDLAAPTPTPAIRSHLRLPGTCDTRSHAYLSRSTIRCSATGTLPSRALGVTLGCEALGTRSPPPDKRATKPRGEVATTSLKVVGSWG
jgi:hypothetical protein